MKQFISFIQKEFYHIARDPLTLSIMFILPAVMLIILGYAISTEFKNTSFVVLDQSKSSASHSLIEKINANSYFSLESYILHENEIEESFRQGKCKAALIIPAQFGNSLLHEGYADIQLVLDASDPNEASTIANYFQMIVLQYQQDNRAQINTQYINHEIKMLYNPQMKSAYNFVPGLIGLIMMLICAMMTSISVVREKEMGTMEILLVSPLKPTTIILSKAVPYLIVALSDVVGILAISHLMLDVPIVGNLALIMLLSFVFTFSALALGLLISSITETQQAAMVLSAVGLMLPSMLLSGLIFPLENMPVLLQGFSCLIPARWFTEALRDVMIKGGSFSTVWKDLLILLSMTIVLLVVSVRKFKNRL